MFRRTRFLQAILPALLTAACAGQPPVKNATGNPPAAAVEPQSGVPARGTTQNPPAAPETAAGAAAAGAAEIRAGRSEASSRPFTLPDGRLDAGIEEFAVEVAQARAIPPEHVQALLREARYDATAAKLMAPAQTRIRRSWVTYRNRFVEPVRIRAGQRFWQENAARLQQVEREYGVPASIIVAIIGVETIYGRNTGNFRVLDALATLGFRYPDASRPERSHMFRNQLADLIQLDYQRRLDARTATGSFAGAMGLPQFMPGSLMRYAADGDRDGIIDLHGSTSDAIASVARFLRMHGWIPGLPVFAPVILPKDPGTLVAGGLSPTLTWEQLKNAGADTADPQPAEWQRHLLGMVNLVDEPRGTVEYRVGTPNFFAITHYNRSYFYAASVADLAQALEHRRAASAQAAAQAVSAAPRVKSGGR